MNTSTMELNLNDMETVNGGFSINWKEAAVTGGLGFVCGAAMGASVGGVPGALVGGVVCGVTGVVLGACADEIWGDFKLHD